MISLTTDILVFTLGMHLDNRIIFRKCDVCWFFFQNFMLYRQSDRDSEKNIVSLSAQSANQHLDMSFHEPHQVQHECDKTNHSF